jgi:hypothetical protein
VQELDDGWELGGGQELVDGWELDGGYELDDGRSSFSLEGISQT